MNPIQGNGPDGVDKLDLLFNTVIVCLLIRVFPLVFDKCLIKYFACFGDVFTYFVVVVADALNFVGKDVVFSFSCDHFQRCSM